MILCSAACQAIADKDANVKKLEHKKQKATKELAGAERCVKELLEAHPWIASERQFFGRAGTDYDFAARDAKQAATELKKLEQEQASLSKRVNKKAMGMMETAEKEYQDVMNKKRIIANDKRKIEVRIQCAPCCIVCDLWLALQLACTGCDSRVGGQEERGAAGDV